MESRVWRPSPCSCALILVIQQLYGMLTMNQSLLTPFGSSEQRVQKALAALKKGQGVILVDDEDRENEGDLIFAAEFLTVPQMAMLIRECSGIVCLCLPDEKLKALDLPPMVEDNTSQNGTAFTSSIEARVGVSTGVSAADRVTTIRTAISDHCRPEDLARPGHVFPLRAQPGGVLTRRGHTEGTVDLVTLAGLKPAGVLCELTHEDGSMMRLPSLVEFAGKHALPVLTIEDLVDYKSARQKQSA
ncbi:MAG: 3,4-dihydroxy-2-butanone-4-phosphate synthase [Endozoicomonas sp.]